MTAQIFLDCGNFPSTLKLANITPVFKSVQRFKCQLSKVNILQVSKKIFGEIYVNRLLDPLLSKVVSFYEDCLLAMLKLWKNTEVDQRKVSGPLLTDL